MQHFKRFAHSVLMWHQHHDGILHQPPKGQQNCKWLKFKVGEQALEVGRRTPSVLNSCQQSQSVCKQTANSMLYVFPGPSGTQLPNSTAENLPIAVSVGWHWRTCNIICDSTMQPLLLRWTFSLNRQTMVPPVVGLTDPPCVWGLLSQITVVKQNICIYSIKLSHWECMLCAGAKEFEEVSQYVVCNLDKLSE